MCLKSTRRISDNIAAFKKAWEEENSIRNSIRRKELSLVSIIEKNEVSLDSFIRGSVLNIYRELPLPVPPIYEEKFKKSLSDSKTILITLRIEDKHEEIVGYVKGGPLEGYELLRGTSDANFGKKNTAFMEWTGIKPGYWGEAGGHVLRLEFLKEAKRRGYDFVTGYVHHNVIISRKNRGETIEIVQEYDPDKLDYYRSDLSKLVYAIPAPDAETLPMDIG